MRCYRKMVVLTLRLKLVVRMREARLRKMVIWLHEARRRQKIV